MPYFFFILSDAKIITKNTVKNAMLAVDRGFFAPSSPYQDSPQPIGNGATISAPHVNIHLYLFYLY